MTVIFVRIARRDRSDLFGTESNLSECREDLRDLIRTDFDHDNVSRSGGIPTFLHGEDLWSPSSASFQQFEPRAAQYAGADAVIQDVTANERQLGSRKGNVGDPVRT